MSGALPSIPGGREIAASFRVRDPGGRRGLPVDGERTAFRVVEETGPGRYRVVLRGRDIEVLSRVPLEVGRRYLAEARTRGDVVELLMRLPPASTRPGAAGPRRRTSVAEILRTLLPKLPGGARFLAGGRTGPALRDAWLRSGLFYEARLWRAIREGRGFPPLRDLKGFLLAAEKTLEGTGLREGISSALKEIEAQQVQALQAMPGGAISLWFPVDEGGWVEGFLKRSGVGPETELIVTWKASIVDSEEVLVAVSWSGRGLEIWFAAAGRSGALLRERIPSLEGRLDRPGGKRTTVRVRPSLPAVLRRKMEGIRFVESYG